MQELGVQNVASQGGGFTQSERCVCMLYHEALCVHRPLAQSFSACLWRPMKTPLKIVLQRSWPSLSRTIFLQILVLLCIGLANGFLLPSTVQPAFRPTRLAGSSTSHFCGTRFVCPDTLACVHTWSEEGAVVRKDVGKSAHVDS